MGLRFIYENMVLLIFVCREKWSNGALRGKVVQYLFSQNYKWQKKLLFGQQPQLTSNQYGAENG